MAAAHRTRSVNGPDGVAMEKTLAGFFFVLGMALSGPSVFVLPRFNLCTHDCGGSLPTEAEQSTQLLWARIYW